MRDDILLHGAFYENCLLVKTSAAGLVKTLQAVNGSTWHDAFLALWMASLRLVQRVSLLLSQFIMESTSTFCLVSE